MFTKTVDYRLTRQGVVEAPPEGELPSYLFDRAVRNLTDVEGLLYQFKIRCVGDAARIVGGASLRVAGVGGGILQLGRIAADETASSLVSVGRRQEEGTGWQRYRYEWIEGREGKPRAACIWGSMDIDLGEDGLRKRIIEAHQRGEIQVLINYGILTEGYDDPTIEAIIVARPTKSRALYTQMIGRGLRPDPAHPERMECLIIDVTGRKVKHKLDVDCAHLFGVEQTTDGAEPMDVFAAAQRADQLMKNSSLRERIRRRLVRETDGAVEYEEFDLLGEVVMPLRVSLREALSSHFDGDETQVAWRLGIQETRLGQYLSGHIDDFPERVEEVERDFARSEEVLEIPTDRVVELWREAKRDWNINTLFDSARTLDQADKGETLLPLPIFLNALALNWGEVSRPVTGEWSRMRAGEDIERLAYQLWSWQRRGVDTGPVEAILEKHDGDDYKRSEVKRDLEALVTLARRTRLKKELLIDEARRHGLLQKLPQGVTYPGFVKICRSKGIYAGELRALASEPRSDAERFTDFAALRRSILEFDRVDPEGKEDLAAFLHRRLQIAQAAAYPLLSEYLLDREESQHERGRVIEILVKRRISLPLPDSFLQGPGLGFLALTPEQHVASLLQERLEPIQDKAVPLFLDATLSSLFSQTMGEAAQTRIRMVAELRSSLLPNAQEEGPLGPRSMPLPPPQMGREWVAARLGTTRGILDQWAEAAHLYGREIGGQSSTLLFDPPIVDAEGRVSDPGGYEPILVERAILVFARVLSEGGVSPVSFMQRTAEVTGRTPAEIVVWWQRIPDEWKKLSQEGRKDPPEFLLQVLLPAKNHMLWKSRGAKQRQAMVIACLTERGYADPREVIREVASWDWETASRPQKTLIDILFKPVNEGGAGFRLRARGDDEGTPT